MAEKPSDASQALKATVRKHGRGVLANLTMSLKTARLYGFKHRNVAAALNELRGFLESFISLEGDCRLSRIQDSLSINDVRLKVDCGSYQTYHHVLELLKDRDTGEVAFLEGLTATELEQLITLLNTRQPESGNPWEQFEKTASTFKMPHIVLRQRPERRDSGGGQHDSSKPLTMGSYFKSVSLMDAVSPESTRGVTLDFKKLTRAIQNMVDLILSEKQLLLALVNIKGNGRPGSNHAVNVAIISVALGAKLGLSKKLLSDLGFAALMHDVGKVHFPDDLRSAYIPDLAAKDFDLYKTHVFRGIERLINDRLTDAMVKSANVAFMHHYRYDRTGYPKLLNPRAQNLYTRIVAVADFYDNATTPGKIYREAASPDAVFRTLVERGGTEFDPLVVKAFVNLMGLYPVGCMVRMDTGEVGTVIEPPVHPRFLDRPTVKIVLDPEGNTVEEQVNLLDRDEGGKFRRTILKLYQQEEVQLELNEYLAVI